MCIRWVWCLEFVAPIFGELFQIAPIVEEAVVGVATCAALCHLVPKMP